VADTINREMPVAGAAPLESGRSGFRPPPAGREFVGLIAAVENLVVEPDIRAARSWLMSARDHRVRRQRLALRRDARE